MKSMEQRIEELRRRRAEVEGGGGKERVEKHRKSGKLTARDRVTQLCDPNSFQESGLFAEHRATLFGMEGKAFPADGVVTGAGTVLGGVCIWRVRILRLQEDRQEKFIRRKSPIRCSSR